MRFVTIKKIVLPILCLGLMLMSGCNAKESSVDSNNGKSQDSPIKIGFSMGTLQEERWQRDRDIFVARAKELGAEVLVQNANNINEDQIKQVKYLIDQGIDILVIIPHDAEKCAESVQMARRAGIKVISYDRLIRNAGTDLYVSFNNVKVGELMAQALIEKVPKGNYVILKGAPTDYNSTMFDEGYMNVLDGPMEKGDITVVGETWCEDWAHEDAYNCVEQTLGKGISIDAIVAANDSLASAAIEALSENRLAGKVAVAGHDADLAACQRVVERTQLMTVYKPIDKIAKAAAEAAIKMVKGENIDVDNNMINDGKYEVPYLMIEPIPVTIDNMKDTIIKDSFHRLEDIYINVPKSQWPQLD